MYVTIDRFEGEFAVVETEDNTMVNLPRCLLTDAKEGDVVLIKVDKEKTKSQQDEINDLMNSLFKD